MKKFVYVLLSALLAVSLSGCTAASKQASAVKDSMKTIIAENILFEHADLGNIKSQLKEQSEGKPDGTGIYTLKVNVSSVAAINTSDLSVSSPKYDLNTTIEDYKTSFGEAVEKAAEKYFSKKRFEETQEFSLKVTLSKDADGKWTANFSAADINKIRSFMKTGVSQQTEALIKEDEGYKTLSALQEFKTSLKSAVPDQELINKITIQKFSKGAESNIYSVEFSCPDPEKVYPAAAQTSYESYKAQGRTIYGPFDSAAAESSFRQNIDKAASSSEAAMLQLSCTYNGTTISGSGFDSFKEKTASVRKEQIEGLVAKVNSEFVIPAVEKPSTKVLSGKNSGQSIAIKTSSSQGDMYVAFYKISSSIEEEGSLVLTAYIRSGKSLTVKLPAGNYKLISGTGDNWYGTSEAFGPKGQYQAFQKVLGIKKNYTYTLTLYGVENGNLPSKSISNPFGK